MTQMRYLAKKVTIQLFCVFLNFRVMELVTEGSSYRTRNKETSGKLDTYLSYFHKSFVCKPYYSYIIVYYIIKYKLNIVIFHSDVVFSIQKCTIFQVSRIKWMNRANLYRKVQTEAKCHYIWSLIVTVKLTEYIIHL